MSDRYAVISSDCHGGAQLLEYRDYLDDAFDNEVVGGVDAALDFDAAFGVDRGLPFPLEALDTASTILMLGSNVAETMPPFVQPTRCSVSACPSSREPLAPSPE